MPQSRISGWDAGGPVASFQGNRFPEQLSQVLICIPTSTPFSLYGFHSQLLTFSNRSRFVLTKICVSSLEKVLFKSFGHIVFYFEPGYHNVTLADPELSVYIDQASLEVTEI